MTTELVLNTIKDNYTRAKACSPDNDSHLVYFKVGVQEFCVTPHAMDCKEDAEHFRMLLARALAQLLDEMRGWEKKE